MLLNFEKSSNMEKNMAEMSFNVINDIIFVYCTSPGNKLLLKKHGLQMHQE